MIRDEELNRLIKYAQGLGTIVRFKPYVPSSAISAECTTDGTEITIYTDSKMTKTDKILLLIHEISHLKSFIANDREIDPKIDEALDNKEQSKRHRKRILDMEIKDSSHWETIYRDTNCQFNINKLHMQRDMDIWLYQFSYDEDRNATGEEKKQKRKELRKKYA